MALQSVKADLPRRYLTVDEAASYLTQWVRVVPNMSLGAYETSIALNGLPDPVFPDLPFRELLRIAFRDRIIDREDHPVIQLLRGAA